MPSGMRIHNDPQIARIAQMKAARTLCLQRETMARPDIWEIGANSTRAADKNGVECIGPRRLAREAAEGGCSTWDQPEAAEIQGRPDYTVSSG